MPRGGYKEPIVNWKEIVEDFENSSLKPSEFCRRRRLATSSLYTWRSRYNKRYGSVRKSPEVAKSFEEVKFLDEPANVDDDIDLEESGYLVLERENNKLFVFKIIQVESETKFFLDYLNNRYYGYL
jgi:hypothetical protein